MSTSGRKSTGLGGLAALLLSIIMVMGWAWFRGRGEPVVPRAEPVTESAPASVSLPESAPEAARPVPPARPSRKEGRQLWAMLVGIEDYDELLAFPSCPDAARDAASMARWLIEEANWGPGNVLLLTDQEPKVLAAFKDPARRPEYRKPTRRELVRGIKEWLTPKVGQGDVVVIFFAGQAMSLPNKPDDRPGQAPRDYLVPWDARGGGIEEEGWRLGDEIEELAARGDVSIVCLLDTSPAGRNRPPDRLGRRGEVPPAQRTRMLEGIARWPSVTAWMAATEKPADVREGHGLLTRAFLEAIGTRDEKRNLQACLQRMRRDPALVGQGFRIVGGFGPELSLWPGAVRPPLLKADPLLQRGHSDQVRAVAFSTDGGRMFTASMDSTLRIWRNADSLLLGVLPRTMNGFWSLALSGDGRLLVAGGGKGDLLFYDLERESIKTPEQRFPHTGPVDRVAILHDGRHVATLDNTGKALLWDAHAAEVKRVRQLADGKQEIALRLSTAARPGKVGAAFAALVKRIGEKPADDREVLRLLDLQGNVLAEPSELPGPISALSLSDEGDRVVVGTEDGSVADFDHRGKAIVPARALAGERIDYLAIQPRWLVAGFGSSLQIIPVEKEHSGTRLELGEPIERVAFSDNGRRVAACGQIEGRVRVWNVAADGDSADVVDLKLNVKADVLSLGFSPEGETLVVGGAGGDVRSWRLPSGEARPAIAAHGGGGIGHIAVAPDERALLQVTRGGAAALWEFGEGRDRGVWRIPGSFRAAGAFLPAAGGALVLITHEGQLAVYDRVNRKRRNLDFDLPTTGDEKGRFKAEFDALSITSDGRWVAAASKQSSLACVWRVADGQLALQTIREQDSDISDVVASDGHRLLLTAGTADGRARVWNLGNAEASPGQLHAVAEATPVRVLGPKDPNAFENRAPVSAAAFSPRVPGRVALGRDDGKIEFWEPEAIEASPVAQLDGRVAAITFSPDGQYVVAAGDDRQIVIRAIANPDLPILLGRGPNHFERVNALASWPSGKLFFSASDDTTIRLWRMDDWRLLGTLASSDDGVEWSVFTPDGLFDASTAGQRRVTWRLDSEDWPAIPEGPVVRLEQVFEQRHNFDLAETLVTRAEIPEPPKLPPDAPPQISLEPVSTPGPKERRVSLRIRISKPVTSPPRLYHNGVVVPGELEGDRQVYEATIALLGGKNQIYAMAGREGLRPDQPTAVDGRSNELELDYEGETPGRTHVLALGVSRYKSEDLRYAHKDAEDFAAFVQQNGIDGAAAAEPIVRLDAKVTRDAVDHAFETLRSQVKAEDTMVVFLAGHTTIRRGLFCLLLPTAEMPAGPDIVALRGLVGEPVRDAVVAPIDDRSVLPYSTIQRHLSMVAALRRLVIVDACEAEAIFDDRGVRALAQKAFHRQAEENAQRYRTSYILATRRGEREAEPTELEHGLLSYVLLRGMGATNLRRPEGLKIFDEYPTADFNNDQWIETSELQEYAHKTVPVLAEMFAGRQRRRGEAPRDRPGEADTKAAISQDDPSTSFPLIKVSRARGGP